MLLDFMLYSTHSAHHAGTADMKLKHMKSSFICEFSTDCEQTHVALSKVQPAPCFSLMVLYTTSCSLNTTACVSNIHIHLSLIIKQLPSSSFPKFTRGPELSYEPLFITTHIITVLSLLCVSVSQLASPLLLLIIMWITAQLISEELLILKDHHT